ncbi:MAG: coenzyme F420-0:L-glutamate ligase [Halobacteriales archaeon]
MRTSAEAVRGVPVLDDGDDLGAILRERVDDADVVCVASTAVSRTEGRSVNLSSVEASERAERLASDLEDADPRFVEVVLRNSVELLVETPFLLSVTESGRVAPNAGVDRSNVAGEDHVLLLPEDPMESASNLSEEIGCPVVVSDTCGRPFRLGQTGVAIGWSDLPATRDWRGAVDLHGHELEATEEAVVDEIAGFANLLMGESDAGTPAVAFDGLDLNYRGGDRVFRPDEEDVVKRALRDQRS